MKRRLTFSAAGIAAFVGFVFVLLSVEVCRDCALIDQNSGSRQGYREWFFAARSGSWYRESGLERFMRANHPQDFSQRWVSYTGTGRNGLGMAMSFRHARPGPIYSLQPEMIDDYCKQASDAEQLQLYNEFAHAERDETRISVDRVYQSVLTRPMAK